MSQIHVEDIQALISFQTKKNTSNILEGSFRSIFRGKSMDFDDLREYSYGDDVSDIDWKASSRVGSTLVRKNNAEKRHFLLFISDTGKKYEGMTPNSEEKSALLTKAFATLCYLANHNTIDYALLTSDNASYVLTSFLCGEAHSEQLLNIYQTHLTSDSSLRLQDLLKHALENIQKRMLIVLLSDIDGVSSLDASLLEEIEERNDVYVLSASDAYLTSMNSYDIEKEHYVYQDYSISKALKQIEKEARTQKENELSNQFHRLGIPYQTLEKEDDLLEKILLLIGDNNA